MAALIAAGYPSDYEGEAYRTVSGQNSNNSVRIPNAFFEKLEEWRRLGTESTNGWKSDEESSCKRIMEPDRLCRLALC